MIQISNDDGLSQMVTLCDISILYNINEFCLPLYFVLENKALTELLRCVHIISLFSDDMY